MNKGKGGGSTDSKDERGKTWRLKTKGGEGGFDATFLDNLRVLLAFPL